MKIALMGKIRSGKDTIGKYLLDNYGMTRFAFGDPLKQYAKEMFPQRFTPGRKPRVTLQVFGQKMREIDPDVWVRHTMNSIEAAGNVSPLITDCRQKNEYDRLKREGFTMIRVNADDGVRIRRMLDNCDDFNIHDLTHETELGIDQFKPDYEIYNDGELEYTHQQIEEIVRDILNRS
ncbi:MAG: AAA family ATPase [Bacillota bacterium]